MRTEASSQMPSFSKKSDFWRELKAEVSKHLAAEAKDGRPTIGDPRLQWKAAVIVVWFALSYGALLLAPFFIFALLAALSLALAAAALGFGVFHDANHRTLFQNGTANLQAARVCSILLGPSRYLWVYKHQSLHHRQPNVFGWDDDLETRGFLRFSPLCPWESRFRRQEIKALLFYGLNTLEWLFWKDFHCLAVGRLNEWHPINLKAREHTEFFVCKTLYFVLIVFPPFLVLPFFWAAASFILFHFVFSWVLAIVFQIAHLTPEMEFSGVRPGDDWATHQLRTTANFATRSRMTTWLTGGLNHQIEHHLFPNVAHTHYSALRPIVRAAALRQGLRYHDLGSVPSALKQHFAFLRALGLESEARTMNLAEAQLAEL